MLSRLTTVVALLAVLAAGAWVGGHPSLLPDPLRTLLTDRDDDEQIVADAFDLVQDEYFRPVSTKRLIDASLTGMVSSLGDDFSHYFDAKTYREFQQQTNSEFSGVGLNVVEDKRGLVVVDVFDRSPAARAGLRAGDLVLAVDGRSLAGRPSAYSTGLIKGEEGTQVVLSVERRGRRFRERLTRQVVDVPVVDSVLRRFHDRPLGIVLLTSFTSGAHGEVRTAVERLKKRGAKGFVLDLRGNGGGLLDEAVLVASVFVEDGVIVTTRSRAQGRRTLKAVGDAAVTPSVPVVVLVDNGTASAAEIVTGALQDGKRARVVGTRTFGKGVFQQIVGLPNGGALDLTVGEYYTPSGRNLGGGGVRRGAGIRPDLRASDDPDTPRDEALLEGLAALVRAGA